MSMKGLLAVAWFSIMPIGMASATYSIVACERETMSCGVAIATHSLAVGDGVPFAQTGLGAGVSQFETNPHHAPAIYSALKNGADAKAALQAALRADTKFGDGQGPAFRQIGLVAAGRGRPPIPAAKPAIGPVTAPKGRYRCRGMVWSRTKSWRQCGYGSMTPRGRWRTGS